MRKRLLAAVALAVLLVAGTVPAASAGVLTSAAYTYLMSGRELELPVDILTIQGAFLVPDELVRALGLEPAITGDAIRLARGPVTIEMQLGSDVAQIDGKPRLLKAGPQMIAGRLFLPAELLPDLGLALAVDGKFVLLSDYLTEIPKGAAQAEAHPLKATVRESSNLFDLEVVALTPALLADESLALPWGLQLKLHALLKTRTLLLVRLTNRSLKAVALDPSKLMLVGEEGRQYDYLKQEISVDGAVTSPIAPGAARVSILAYAQVDGPHFDLYHDGAQSVLGRLPAR